MLNANAVATNVRDSIINHLFRVTSVGKGRDGTPKNWYAPLVHFRPDTARAFWDFSQRLLWGHRRPESRRNFRLKFWSLLAGSTWKHGRMRLKNPGWKSLFQLAGNYEDNSLVKDSRIAGVNQCYRFLAAKRFEHLICSHLDDFSVEV